MMWIRKSLLLVALLFSALILSSCLHATQEATCKVKFKKKYHCPFSKITIVENELDMGNHIKLRGCGKTVIYNGTKEILAED